MKVFYVEIIYENRHFYVKAKSKKEVEEVLKIRVLDAGGFHVEEVKIVGLPTVKRKMKVVDVWK